MDFLEDQDIFEFDLHDHDGFLQLAQASRAEQYTYAAAIPGNLQDVDNLFLLDPLEPGTTAAFGFDLGPLEFDPYSRAEPLEPLEDDLLSGVPHSSDLEPCLDFVVDPKWSTFLAQYHEDAETWLSTELDSHPAPAHECLPAVQLDNEIPIQASVTPFLPLELVCPISPNISTRPPIAVESSAAGKKPRSSRTQFSSEDKAVLEKHFSVTAYPSADLVSTLASQMSLPAPVLKTWFANARQRKDKPNHQPPAIPEPTNCVQLSSPDSPSEPVSVENLETLDRTTPPPSNVSLDRFLASSRADEPVVTQMLLSSTPNYSPTQNIDIPAFKRSASDVVSVGSVGSMLSVGSFRSGDSRGSRQGRATWKKQTAPPIIPADLDVSGSKLSDRYFCTWPGCNQRFRHRFDWTRHEEAVHYAPYHWVCCSPKSELDYFSDDCGFCDAMNVTLRHVAEDHFSACSNKTRQQRTFLRADQFVAHLRLHFGKAPKAEVINKTRLLARLWKENNLALNHRALHCGICGREFMTWADRSTHVDKHMELGFEKSAWWQDRLPALPNHVLESSVSRSCRYLQDALSICRLACARCGHYIADDIAWTLPEPGCKQRWCRARNAASTLRLQTYDLQCRLCDFCIESKAYHAVQEFEDHVQVHQHRGCKQLVYKGDPNPFRKHLEEEHCAMAPHDISSTEEDLRFKPWEHKVHPRRLNWWRE